MNRIKLAIICSVVGLTACGSNMKSASTTANQIASNLDPGAIQQAASINCSINNQSQPGQVQEIHTLDSMDTFFSANPKQGDNLAFDCSGTTDDGGGVTFAIDTAYDPANPHFTPLTGDNFNLNMGTTGANTIAIQATDGEGLVRIKTFTVIVQCPTAVSPVLNVAGVHVTPGSMLNYFNYSVDSSAVSGGTGFKFAWDFNGDGVFDPYSMSNPNVIWTNQNTVSNVYSIFANNRTIGLKVVNNCGYETDYQVSANFPMDNIARTPSSLAVVKPYYYIQADLSSATLSGQRYNGDLLVTKYPADQYRRVQCDYKYKRVGQPASFTLEGFNWYDGTNSQSTNPAMVHGLDIAVQGIPDNGGMALQSYDQSNGVNIPTADYIASAASDGFPQMTFSRGVTGCTVHINIKRAVGVAPCDPGKTTVADVSAVAVQIYGEYDCPSLVNPQGQSVALHNGKFFCEVAPVDQCIGGGGGGGGVPPPQQ